MGFWSDVVEQIKKAITPIPDELRKYQAFWSARKFSPEVNAKLLALQSAISPLLVKAIIEALGNYKRVSAMAAEKKINEVFEKLREIIGG